MLERRGFLRGLVSLPLIGGGVTLIGEPAAAAVPVTDELLGTYEQWLGIERVKVCSARYGVFRAQQALERLSVYGTAYDWHQQESGIGARTAPPSCSVPSACRSGVACEPGS